MAPTMSALDELINTLVNFTPEQLQAFLSHEITLSILQPEATSESCLPGVSSNAQ
jgi:hypothetical protein